MLTVEQLETRLDEQIVRINSLERWAKTAAELLKHHHTVLKALDAALPGA